MMTAAWVLAICSIIIEMFIAANLDFYRRAASKYWLVGLTASLALSYGLGMLFGAAGVTVLMASVISTIGSLICYKAWDHVMPMVTSTKAALPQVQQTTKDFFKLIWMIIRFVTWPFRAVRAIVRFSSNINSKFRGNPVPAQP